MNSLLASILVVVVLGILVQGAKYGEECGNDDDCSETGNYCGKFSDCDKGTCACKQTYYRDGVSTTCKEVGTMLAKGDSCDTAKVSKDEQKCEGSTVCIGCKAGDTSTKCRSGASVASLTTPLLLLAAAIFKLF